tara:strand:- start:280781 stop:282853 length:2073 start_codon:yes stop_codon:yes gene_type:complete
MDSDKSTPSKNDDPKSEKESLGDTTTDWRSITWMMLMALIAVWLWQNVIQSSDVRTIPYSQFKTYVANEAVKQCEIGKTEITGTIDAALASATDGKKAEPPSGTPAVLDRETESATDTEPPGSKSSSAEATHQSPAEQPPEESTTTYAFRTVRVEDPELIEDLQSAGVEFTGLRPNVVSTVLLTWIIPLALLFLLWSFFARRMASVGQGVMGFGKSRAKIVANADTGVTFSDVAGCDEAKYELQEVVDFLQHPDKYAKLGAKIPKGVLLVGPPGTGKTLLARAVAGEAGVPFFSLSGSDFVEMFVGVGASRVRDLFDQATKTAPCIVFLDELDAIGRQRGVHIGAANDEREQTLNQLLVEMDGFEANVGVILLAATNRPDVLDTALLRPGRFDRQVVLDAPDIRGRQAILNVHSKNKPLGEDVDLETIAQETPGFSGADLANVMNEGALLSARRQSGTISQSDLEEAVEKVVAGPERKSRRLEPDEKRRVAYHETGHAIVSAFCQTSDPVHKISIVPRGKAALGYTMQLPVGERFIMTKTELLDRLRGLLGGRAAEDIQYGEISTGAENDLETATAMARQMVCMYGMSEKVGLTHCARRENEYLPDSPYAGTLDCSPDTAHEIDQEVRQLLDNAYRDAKRILNTHRDVFERVAQALFTAETLDEMAFSALLNQESHPQAERTAEGVTQPT